MKYQSIIQSKSFQIFELQKPRETKNPFIVFDADGVLFDLSEGDHWNIAINQLPKEAKKRIQMRIALLSKSPKTYDQQYLSASSLYEFNNYEINLQNLAPLTRFRSGAIELLKYLQKREIPIIIISHGIKTLIQESLNYNKLNSIKVHANPEPSKSKELYTPPYENLAAIQKADNSTFQGYRKK